MKTAKQILEETKAVINDSHVVYTSGRHGTAYINKDAIYPHTAAISALCRMKAIHFADKPIDCVVAPAVGGIPLSQWTAFHLSEATGRDVLSTFVEREEETIFIMEADESRHIPLPSWAYTEGNEPDWITLRKGYHLVVKKPTFTAKRGYDKLLAGKNVLVVEDILTTGTSARNTIETARLLGCEIIGLGVLCNRGSVTREMVGNPPELFALMDVKLDSWPAEECPLCAKKVTINTTVGKGGDFLASKAGKAIYG